AGGRLWIVEDAVGLHQSFPTVNARHHVAFRRQCAEHPSRLPLGDLGFARLIWRACVSKYQEVVWIEREQFRRGGRVWQDGPGAGGVSRRRERTYRVAPFQ